MTAVSIIIPYHNSAGCDRREMLDALIATIPDRPDVEIIAVDDHSELTWTPARPPAQARLHLIPNRPERRYAGTARNTGLEHATGQFVLFADSDDLYVTDALDELIDRAAADEAVDVILFRMGSFRDDGQLGQRHNYIDKHIRRYREMGVDPLLGAVSPCVKMIRRDFIAAHALVFGNTRVAEDNVFAVALAIAGPRLELLDRVVYRAREGNQGLTTGANPERTRERIKVLIECNLMRRRAGVEEVAMLPRLAREMRTHPFVTMRDLMQAAVEGHRILPPLRECFMRVRAKRTRS